MAKINYSHFYQSKHTYTGAKPNENLIQVTILRTLHIMIQVCLHKVTIQSCPHKLSQSNPSNNNHIVTDLNSFWKTLGHWCNQDYLDSSKSSIDMTWKTMDSWTSLSNFTIWRNQNCGWIWSLTLKRNWSSLHNLKTVV